MLKKMMRFYLVAILLVGCSSVQVQEYKEEKPVLRLEDYLKGDLEAFGMFQDRSGKVIKRFHVTMKGTWVQDTGKLEEDFVYSDGSKSRRVWTIKKISEMTSIREVDISRVLEDLTLMRNIGGNHIVIADKRILSQLYKKAGKPGHPVYSEKLIWTPYKLRYELG